MTRPNRIDGMNRDDAVDEGALVRTLGKICCLTARGHAHVPDGSMELWDKTCEAHDFNVILSLMTPFIKALAQPSVLFLRLAVRERVIHSVGTSSKWRFGCGLRIRRCRRPTQ